MTDSESDGGMQFTQLWEVLDILGQRSGSNGIVEVLVMWKASWIPKSNLQPGTALANWDDTRKTRQDVLIDSELCCQCKVGPKRDRSD